jgi:hypothetical protein
MNHPLPRASTVTHTCIQWNVGRFLTMNLPSITHIKPVTFSCLAVSTCTTSLNVQTCCMLPTEYLYVLYISRKKSKVIPI